MQEPVNGLSFNVLVKEEEGLWTAHCLELDIVAAAESGERVERDVVDLIIAAVDYAFSNDNVENLYHPAPKEAWNKFFALEEL